MKIVHISDIHIRNLKYHESYRKAFEDLYRHLDEIQPDLVINTGDTAHTKVQISPEFVEMCSEHFRRVSEYAPYHILLGNHDLNLVNLSRQDAITPIVNSIGSSTKHPIVLHKKSGVYSINDEIDLYVFSCADVKNYPNPAEAKDDKVNIGLYHGAISSAVTDTNWEMDDCDDDTSLFDGLDYTLLGDIHQHQFLDQDGRIAYAGSLIQQNFGEKPDKGFLLWDIQDKNEWDVDHIKLKGSKRFFTVELNEDFSIPDTEVEPGARIRITTKTQFTLADQQHFERLVKKKFKTTDVITVPPQNIGSHETESVLGKKIKIANLRDTDVQENLIREFLKDRKLPDNVLSKIFELNKKFQTLVEKDEDIIRDVFWKIETIGWSNMFNYGENNIIDFSKIKGISGLFAPNSAGKSSLIDIILESLYDKTTTGVSKNMFLVNDNKKVAKMIAEISAGDESFTIERKIEKIKYGKRKLEEEKEWGKTSVGFVSTDESGKELESFNGQSRPETEKNIRKYLGTYEDFVMTSLLAQSRETDIIKCKETDRKKILYKFMDLDVFDQKYKLAKDDGRPHFQRLKDFDDGDLETICENESMAYSILNEELNELKMTKLEKKKELAIIREELQVLRDSKKFVDNCGDQHTTLRSLKQACDDGLHECKVLDKLKEECNRLSLEVLKLSDSSTSTDIEKIEKSLIEYEHIALKHKEAQAVLEHETKILERWNKDVTILSEVPCGNEFPTCKFLTNAFDKKRDIINQRDRVIEGTSKVELLESKLNEIDLSTWQRASSAYKNIIESLESKRTLMSQCKLKIENKKLKVVSIFEKAIRLHSNKTRWEKNKEAIESNNIIDNNIIDVDKKRFAITTASEHLDKRMLAVTKDIGSKESLVAHLKKELGEMKDLRTLCDAYEHYSDTMGKHGIAYKILVEKLPLINDEINKILSSVANFNVFIEHDRDENSIRLYLKYGDYVGRRLELAGGAEKLMASIAIRTALLSITNLPKTNMFIIDEGFGSLDGSNIDNINKLFDYLRTVFDHVLIISHIDVMKDMVDNNIEISVDEEGYSHVEVI